MTVQDLMLALGHFDPNAEVLVFEGFFHESRTLESVVRQGSGDRAKHRPLLIPAEPE